MSTFVLLHGAFHGAWCWSRVTPLLEAQGHRVLTPTQTGLGERAHLRHPGLTLTDFADDLVTLLETEDLAEAVLVGHSFGGNAIAAAADRVPARIRHLVFLDAALPTSGVSPQAAALPAVAEARRRAAAATPDNTLPAPPVEMFGIPPGPDADGVAARLTPHPFGTMDTALTLRHPLGNGLPATYVACTGPEYKPLAWARSLARTQPGWAWRELAAGHDCMVTAPQPTATLLMELAP